MGNAGSAGHSAGETSLAAATAAIITARWTASATKGAGSSANGHHHSAGSRHDHTGNGHDHAEGNGHGGSYGTSASSPFDGHGLVDSHGWSDAAAPGDGSAEAQGVASAGFDSPTGGFSGWAPPAGTELPRRSVPEAPEDTGPVLVHGQGPGFGEAAASFFSAVAPDPVPEVFDPFIPAQRGTDAGLPTTDVGTHAADLGLHAGDLGLPGGEPGLPGGDGGLHASGLGLPAADLGLPGRSSGLAGRDPMEGWEQVPGHGAGVAGHALGQEEFRTHVPPGFERRDFGPFPDEPPAAAPAPAAGTGPDRPRGFETVAPAALLGSLPSAPSGMPASFAPPEPEPWTDPGWVGFGDLAPPSEHLGGSEQLLGAGARSAGGAGHAPGTLPRRVPQIPDIPDFPILDGEFGADPIEEHRNLNRVATFLRDEEDGPGDQPRPDGIDLAAVLDAVRGVPHVRDAQIRWNGHAGHTLRIEFTDGVDQSEVTRSVVKLLRQRLGLAALPSTEEPTLDSPFRGRVAVGSTGRAPAARSAGGPASVAPGRALARPSTVETPRLAVENVTVTRLGAEAVVEVRLRLPGGAIAVGEGRGPGVDAYLSRLAATAAAHAVDRALAGDGRERGRAFIEHVSVVPFGVVEVAVVVLLLSYDGTTEQLSGSAIVGDDPHLAVVRATLAGLNRRLESLLG